MEPSGNPPATPAWCLADQRVQGAMPTCLFLNPSLEEAELWASAMASWLTATVVVLRLRAVILQRMRNAGGSCCLDYIRRAHPEARRVARNGPLLSIFLDQQGAERWFGFMTIKTKPCPIATLPLECTRGCANEHDRAWVICTMIPSPLACGSEWGCRLVTNEKHPAVPFSRNFPNKRGSDTPFANNIPVSQSPTDPVLPRAS